MGYLGPTRIGLDEQILAPKNTVHVAIPTAGDHSRDTGSPGWYDC
jgi:hypothetical protein